MTPPLPNRCADLKPAQAKIVLALLGLVAIAGMFASWNKGNLPRRAESPPPAAEPTPQEPSENIAPDLQLYRDVTAAVAQGKNYYAEAKPLLIKHGFPVRRTDALLKQEGGTP